VTSVTRAAGGMGVATAISRGFGFVRVLVVAAILGTTYLGNTFQATNSFSNVLFELIAAGALSAVLVPTFVEMLQRREDAEDIAGRLLGLALLGLGAVAVAGVLAAPWLADVLVGDAPASVADDQQALATFLLRFFIPQIVLYAIGTIAIAVLYAQHRLAITALAPIGNTIVVVVAMLVFRALAGPGDVGLDLSTAEKLTLALGGTLGVAAFVAVPVVALHRRGFRLWPRWPRHDERLGRLLRLSGWAVFQHAEVGLLLGTALIIGNGVAGGVVAYQVAFVFFLAPYAVLAQPIHTAILPELTREAVVPSRFAASVRWALDSMAVLVVPVAAAACALALPAMRAVAFGEATAGDGVELLAAGVASLVVGLYGYGAFLLVARAFYALGNSRTPAVVALVTGLAGVAVMVVAGSQTDGAARVAALGLGHSAAYLAGTVVLAAMLWRRLSQPIWPRLLPRIALVAALIGTGVWLGSRAVDPSGRWGSLAVVTAGVVLGGAAYIGGLALLRVPLPRRHGVPAPGAEAP
jgi:putative peptidoglycan lipid II flippase